MGKKVAELEGEELDYWVAKALGWSFFWSKHYYYSVTEPSGERHICFDNWKPFDPDTGKKVPAPKPHECIWECGFCPSMDWNKGGPIIEREHIHLESNFEDEWSAGFMIEDSEGEPHWKWMRGNTPLIAAMRAYVASVYGEEVPDA